MGSFGARWAWILDHRAQHLCGRDHGFAQNIRLPDHHLLHRGNLFWRDFESEVPARHHDPVDLFQNSVDMIEGFMLLDLGDDRNRSAASFHFTPGIDDIVAIANEGEGNHINFVLNAESKVLFVAARQSAKVETALGKMNALVRAENAANHDPTGNAWFSDFDDF